MHFRSLSFLIASCFVVTLPACGGSDDGEGTGGAGGGGTGGAVGSGSAPGIGGGGTGGSGGTGGGESTGGTTGGSLDTVRVALARKMKRRISLGDTDNSACIVTTAGGVECRGLYVRNDSLAQPVDLVAFSGLGYCVIYDDTSTMCDLADNVSDDDEAFAAGIGNAGALTKAGTDGILAVLSAGGVKAWNGQAEISATAPPGSFLSGYDIETCTVSPDGLVNCFEYTGSENVVDKSGFTFETTKYVDLDQSLLTIAGITEEGILRTRTLVEDADLTYSELQVQVATESDYWCMVSNTGTLRCDAYNPDDLASRGLDKPPAGEFLVVDVNSNFACGVRPTGAVECWGKNPPTFDSMVRLD